MLISSGHERNESILDLPENKDERRDSSDIEFELSKHQRKNSHMQNDVSGVLVCLLHSLCLKITVDAEKKELASHCCHSGVLSFCSASQVQVHSTTNNGRNSSLTSITKPWSGLGMNS